MRTALWDLVKIENMVTLVPNIANLKIYRTGISKLTEIVQSFLKRYRKRVFDTAMFMHIENKIFSYLDKRQ